jgi:hypothetical protein
MSSFRWDTNSEGDNHRTAGRDVLCPYLVRSGAGGSRRPSERCNSTGGSVRRTDFVANAVLEEAGFSPEGDEDVETFSTAQPAIETKEQRLEQLQSQLAEAIKKEDYEEAARLRDELRRLQLGD